MRFEIMPDSFSSHSNDPALAKKIASLARLRMSDEELDETSEQFAATVRYIHHLDEVEIPDGTDPFYGASELVNAVRDDEVRPSLPRETILSNAPQTDGKFYIVPPVF